VLTSVTEDVAEPAVEVRPVAASERAALAGMLTEAFDREEFAVWCDPEPDQRRTSLGATFEHVLGQPGVLVDVTADRLAAAVWVRSDSGVYLGPLGEVPERVAEASARINAAAPIRRRAYYYLAFLGAVERGAGRGSALLQHRLALADAEDAGSALVTSSDRNQRFYERHGYTVTTVIDLGDCRPRWMWRDPAGG
jgi:GNAT superfamily N-acetyltransferase